MIYLIDDKRLRQEGYGWSEEDFKKYESIIKPIYNKKELDRLDKNELFNPSNIILFHESFFDNPVNKHLKHLDNIKQDLLNLSRDKNMMILFFSGSFGSRRINNNIASVPTQLLYKNLEYFLSKYEINHELISLKDIVFGLNYNIEEILLLKLEIWENVYNQSGIVVFKPKLNQLLERFSELTGIIISTESCSIEYLKYQINNNLKLI